MKTMSFENQVGLARNRLSETWHQEIPKHFHVMHCTFESAEQHTAFCFAKDWLQDTSDAIAFVFAKDFSDNPSCAYIEFWGLLQAVFVQQDAIRELYYAITGSSLENSGWNEISDESAWKKIRTFRNLAVGHPTRQGQKSPPRRSVTGRQPKKLNCVQITVNNGRRTKTENTDLAEMFIEYDRGAATMVDRLHETLKQQIKQRGYIASPEG